MQVKYQSLPNVFPFWVLQSYLILPPSAWLFARLNTKTDFVFTNKYLLLYIPAGIDIIIQTAWYLYRHFTGPLPSLLEFKLWFLFAEFLPIVWMVAVLFMYGRTLLSLSGQAKDRLNLFSAIHLFKIYGLFTFLVLLTTLWIGGVLFNLQIFGYIELLLTFFLFALGYIGYFNPNFFNVPKLLKSKTAESNVAAFPNYDDQKELHRLTNLFEQEGLHTRSKLSLEELAGELKLPPRYVSYLINTYHTTNFHHFVNAYRVKEVIRKINDPAQQHKTLLALALESGFNSKSTFNQVFKSHTGQSPSEFLLLKR